MQAEDGGAGGVAANGEGQASPGDTGNPDGPGGHEGPGRGDSGEAGADAGPAPQVSRPFGAPRPAADAEPGTIARNPQPPLRRRLQFSITVSFQSHVGAVLAFQYLAQCPQPQRTVVKQELIVVDNLLTLQLTSEDPGQLLMAFSSRLHEFCLLIRTMQHIMPPFLLVNPRSEEED